MRHTPSRDLGYHRATIELCEVRQYFSAMPVADFQVADFQFDDAIEQQVDPTLAADPLGVFDLTGVTSARSQYGFTGAGQTVVIIDSGIAYDHPALGGGFGTSYRVVGGWDFAENDADPYDDAPGGAHGTHVAGIVGSTASVAPGVAPGVDLVALRVFNDMGGGSFAWVEQALQWVHEHRASFDNPITTINLSLGTTWNASNTPAWAMLEDEFAQLKSDGIFISVAAGNSFMTYNAPGLSYPAASSHVVPVSSVDANGNLSNFSQRLDRVIAAPGRSILSSVPDYVGNINGKSDDYAAFSGTSMAAPFVAGASALIRQALQFVGTVNITQDTIYNVMRQTADSVFDAVTNQTYFRINVGRALDSVMPADDHGSTIDTADPLGRISTASIAGLISRLDDRDYFSFTAAHSGTARFTVTGAGDVQLITDLHGASGTLSGDTFTFEVIAGQHYTIGMSSSGGLGSYRGELEVTPQIVQLGIIDFTQVTGQNLAAGDAWFAFSAAHDGITTIEALCATLSGSAGIEVYDAAGNLLGSAGNGSGAARLDLTATAGDTFHVRLVGTNPDVALRLTNLVARVGGTVNVVGTQGADNFTFQAGSTLTVSINGVEYQFSGDAVQQVNFHGDGADTARLVGSSGIDWATLAPRSATLRGDNYSVVASGMAVLSIEGGAGMNQASFYDSSGDDSFSASAAETTMSGDGYSNSVTNFTWIEAQASGGYDQAILVDTAGDDWCGIAANVGMLFGPGFRSTVWSFDRVEAKSIHGGNDTASLWDSAGDDTLTTTSTSATLVCADFTSVAIGFSNVTVNASRGWDVAHLQDSEGDDVLSAAPKETTLSGNGFSNTVRNFDRVEAVASSGYDRAIFVDSEGDDWFGLSPSFAMLCGQGFYIDARHFDRVEARSVNGGHDLAMILVPDDAQPIEPSATDVVLEGSDFSHNVDNFAMVLARRQSEMATVSRDFYDLVFRWLARQ